VIRATKATTKAPRRCHRLVAGGGGWTGGRIGRGHDVVILGQLPNSIAYFLEQGSGPAAAIDIDGECFSRGEEHQDDVAGDPQQDQRECAVNEDLKDAPQTLSKADREGADQMRDRPDHDGGEAQNVKQGASFCPISESSR
jgi:hypothetical protein